MPSGSFFSILGPSGCGKTTLMRMIAGFETPTSGDIRIKGDSVIALPPNRRNVKMVFQHLALFPMMNVHENIAYGLRCRGAGKDEITRKVGEVLERIGLPDSANKEISQLSGGQKQRIAIARCMVLDPDVLLLDEPLGALDLKLREHMKIELKALQHEFDTTFVYITHDQSEALVMSDNVAVMKDGRFEQVGSPQDLYHNPQTPFVAGFVGDSNRWSGKVKDVNNGIITATTDSGLTLQSKSATGDSVNAGEDISIFVRPEAVQLHLGDDAAQLANAGGDLNHMPVTVESMLFNGANSRILVNTHSGERIEVDLPQRGEHSTLRSGDKIGISWAQSQSLCFRGNYESRTKTPGVSIAVCPFLPVDFTIDSTAAYRCIYPVSKRKGRHGRL
ncbi:ABC transporter ATP-binding protein [Aliamphritea spongicola]|nr:ABC transporter ATP-binding protein [Aliamphritea spongicola]